MKAILVLFCLITFNVCFIKATTIQFIDQRNQSYVNLNEDVEISCIAEDLGGKTVRWTHNEKQIALVAGGQTIIYMDPEDESKYTLIGDDVNGGNFTLIIRQFNIDDVGTVTCDVNGVPPATKRVDLFQRASAFYLSYQSSKPVYEMYTSLLQYAIYIGPNQTVNITCHSLNTRPVSVLNWFTDGIGYDLVQNVQDTSTNNNLYNATRNVIFSANDFLNFQSLFTTAGSPVLETQTTNIPENNKTTDQPINPNLATTTTQIIDEWVILTCEANIDENIYLREVNIHIGEYPTALATTLQHDFVLVSLVLSFFIHLLIF